MVNFNKTLLFLLFTSISLFSSVDLDISKIENYKVIKEFYLKNESKVLVIRSFSKNENNYFLALDLDNLTTFLIDKNKLLEYKKVDNISDTNYSYLCIKALNNKDSLTNAGITKILNKPDFSNIYLTIDMCPSSKKGFEKSFFKKIIKDSNKKTAIAIAITNKWIKTHKKDFEWILENKNYFDITWINHSSTHYYDKNEKDLEKNFILHHTNNFEVEILEVEKMLILNGEIPSLLFRFPGLVSNKYLIEELIKKYSLIPIGTNNWLAKEEKSIETGDIILIHGNLNEHKGIEILNNNISKYNLAPILDSLK